MYSTNAGHTDQFFLWQFQRLSVNVQSQRITGKKGMAHSNLSPVLRFKGLLFLRDQTIKTEEKNDRLKGSSDLISIVWSAKIQEQTPFLDSSHQPKVPVGR